tara:strand:- start:8805 stop:9170 length:366 start_codon:yes stop_codon:yes gene_type:complete
MENVVKMEDLASHVQSTLAEIRKGLSSSQAEDGIIVAPELDVQFSMVVVAEDGWQALEDKSTSQDTGEDKTTTTDNSESKGTSGGTTKTELNRTREEEDSGTKGHVQNTREDSSHATAETA